jgi:hypothetical protein
MALPGRHTVSVRHALQKVFRTNPIGGRGIHIHASLEKIRGRSSLNESSPGFYVVRRRAGMIVVQVGGSESASKMGCMTPHHTSCKLFEKIVNSWRAIAGPFT